jgi:hypothetical protein
MPTSAPSESQTQPPSSPAGYADPTAFRYPLPVVFGLVVVLTPVAAVLFGGLLWYAQGPAVLDTVFRFEQTPTGFSFTIGSSVALVAFVGTVAVVTALHELVHGLVYQLRGYRVSYGVAPRYGAFYACPFGQFQRRDDNLVTGVAPLVVLDLLLVPLLFAPSPLLAFAAFVGLLVNTVGAAGDVYLLARLLRMPRETLLYDSDIRHSYVFYPAT